MRTRRLPSLGRHYKRAPTHRPTDDLASAPSPSRPPPRGLQPRSPSGDPARISLDTIKLFAAEGPGDLPLARSFDTAAISLVIESTGRAVTVVTAAMLGTLFHVRMCGQATPDFLQHGRFYLRRRFAFSSYDR